MAYKPTVLGKGGRFVVSREACSSTKWVYEYAVRDHLGNTRAMFSGDGDVTDSDIQSEYHYYPFGMEQEGVWQSKPRRDNKYRFGGKEVISDLGLGLYDFTNRTFAPDLGRFLQVDKLADQRSWLTPYNYVQNNPIIRVDPDGMLDSTYHINMNTGAQTTLDARGGTDTDYYILDNGLSVVDNNYVGTTYEVDNTTPEFQITGTGQINSTENPLEMLLEAPVAATKAAGVGLLALIRGVAKSKADDIAKTTVKSQADDIAQEVGKNSVSITTPNGKMHYDLRGAQHKGVPTPHVQKSVRNVNPTTGASFYNKNRKYVRGMTQQDIRIIKNYLKRQNKN